MDDSDPDHWLEVLTENEAVLAELGDSPDPVAQRQIAKTLFSTGNALSELGRSSEAISLWDELLRRLAVNPSAGPERMVLRVLLRKAIDLEQIGDRAQAVEAADAVLTLSASVDQPDMVRNQVLAALLLKLSVLEPEDREAAVALNIEIIRRFTAAAEPLIHEQVTTAIVRAGMLRLLQDRVDDAIQTGPAIAKRLETAPADVLGAEADLANQYGRVLNGFAGTDTLAVAEIAAFVSYNAAVSVWRALVVQLVQLGGLRGDPSVQALKPTIDGYAGRVIPTSWKEAHRRIQMAIELQELVVTRIGDGRDPELQRVATIARIQTACARLAIGDLRRGVREITAVLDSSDPATIQAFQSTAAGLRGRSDLMGQIGELSRLSWRAHALGQGDTRIEQIAYEDSIAPLLADTNRRSVRWFAAFLRPDERRFSRLSTKAKGAARNLRRASLR